MSRVEKKQPEYGSDVIVDMMKAHDIEYTAFNPGATFRGIHDSIVNYGGNYKPEVIFCHHEEISVAIAHGYAKAKNKPMIAIVPQHGRFAACQHGDFQRLHRPRADDGARRHRADGHQTAPAAHRLDPHRAGPRQSGARLHQVGRSALFFGRRAGFVHSRLPHRHHRSDRAGLHQLRCRHSRRRGQGDGRHAGCEPLLEAGAGAGQSGIAAARGGDAGQCQDAVDRRRYARAQPQGRADADRAGRSCSLRRWSTRARVSISRRCIRWM